MITIPCVIFAGGKSSRMGEDKALLPFSNFSTLTEFQLQRLKKIFTHVYISCKDFSKFNFDASFIIDSITNNTFAPTTGFIASFQFLREDSFFCISVDTPFISQEVIQALVFNDINSVDATVARTPDGIQPLCGVYHRSLEKEFLKMQDTNNHKLEFLLKKSKINYIDFKDDTTFLNLNNPQDYAKALTLV